MKHLLYFAILHSKHIPVKLDYTFLLTFLNRGEEMGRVVCFLILSPDSADDQHTTENSAFDQCRRLNDSSFYFLVLKMLNESLNE